MLEDLAGGGKKSVSQLTAHFFGMVFLVVIHAGLIIWASTLAISFLYRVDLSSESVKVNDALEVFGERDMDPSLWMDGSSDGSIRQAHIRIGSRGSAFLSAFPLFFSPLLLFLQRWNYKGGRSAGVRDLPR